MIFKKVTTCFNFDVVNIIISYIIFEKPLDYIIITTTCRQNIHNLLIMIKWEKYLSELQSVKEHKA